MSHLLASPLRSHENLLFHTGGKLISTNPFLRPWVDAEQILLDGHRVGGDRLLSLVGRPGAPLPR
jgi:hypothetical protein